MSGLIVGVDEAGLGPNLGPLVIAASVWRTRGEPAETDPIDALPGVLSRTARPDRVCVADSKALFSQGGGWGELVRSTRTALAVCGREPETVGGWLAALGSPSPDGVAQPWFEDLAIPLPGAGEREHNAPIRSGGFQPPAASAASGGRPGGSRRGSAAGSRRYDGPGIAELAAAWRAAGAAAGAELVGLHADVLFAPRFNAELARLGGKGRLLTAASLGLLARAWNPRTAPPTRVECDKHGGRNFYAAALAEAFADLPGVLREGAAGSEYTLLSPGEAGGRHRIAFRPRNEAFGPVALASLVAKFTRELLMGRFNAWWADRVPGLRPTAGYPTDARRFRADTAAARAARGIAEEAFWRMK